MLMRSLVVALLLAQSSALMAQTSEPCVYATCALGISPRLTALDVVRGDAQARVGSLSFLWPRATLVRAFDADALAATLARQSVRTRRTAAVLTGSGIALVVAGAARAALVHGDARWSACIAAAGVGAIGVSIPVQFAADAQLSRAVFEFNRRFAR
jgi:hypothetical protein